jgi:phage shock protein E
MKFKTLLRHALLLPAMAVAIMVWAADITWIDVRSAEEFGQNHVPQAVNIPYDQIESGIAALQLDKDQVIYLYCGSGRRAGIAKQALDALGYTQVTNVGGIDAALAKAGEQTPQ